MKRLLVLGIVLVGCGHHASSPFGGIRMTFKADLSALPVGADRQALMKETLTKLESRTASLPDGESRFRQVGSDTITFEMAGKVTLAEARAALLSSNKVGIFWARNLTTDLVSSRPFVEIEMPKAGKSVEFTNIKTGEKIASGTDTYTKLVAEWVPILEENEIKSASPVMMNGDWVPSFEFSDQGAKRILAWCRANANRREKLALVIDGEVVNVVPLQDGALIEKQAVIDGKFPTAVVRDIAAKANGKPLPLKLIEVDAKEFRP